MQLCLQERVDKRAPPEGHVNVTWRCLRRKDHEATDPLGCRPRLLFLDQFTDLVIREGMRPQYGGYPLQTFLGRLHERAIHETWWRDHERHLDLQIVLHALRERWTSTTYDLGDVAAIFEVPVAPTHVDPWRQVVVDAVLDAGREDEALDVLLHAIVPVPEHVRKFALRENSTSSRVVDVAEPGRYVISTFRGPNIDTDSAAIVTVKIYKTQPAHKSGGE